MRTAYTCPETGKGEAMIENLRIDGFRGLDGVCLDALGQFNLFVGPGNTGKTNLIEALFLFCSNGDPTLIRKALVLRRIDPVRLHYQEAAAFIDWFFTVGVPPRRRFEIDGTWKGERRSVVVSKLDGGNEIPLRQADGDAGDEDERDAFATYEIETRTEQSTHSGRLYITGQAVKFKTPTTKNIPGRIISPLDQGRGRSLATVWTEVEEHEEHSGILALLRTIDAEITDIRIVADALGQASIRVQHETLGRMPPEFLGAGFGKAIAIACYTAAIRNGLLLVDEFDASLHPGAQPSVIEFLMRTAEEHNVQICASTHSIETVDAFLEAYDELSGLFKGPQGLRVFQLRRTKGQTEVTSLDAETARRLREDIGHDLRLRA